MNLSECTGRGSWDNDDEDDAGLVVWFEKRARFFTWKNEKKN